MRFSERIRGQSVTRLIQLACYLALLGLAIMMYSLVNPRALPVIFAMSGGHLVGALAVCCYIGAILIDVSRSSAERAARKIRASDSPESEKTSAPK